MEKVSKKASKSKAATGGKDNGNSGGYLSGQELSEEALLEFLGNSGALSEDRYRLLDARDKLMRLKLKNADVVSATALVGTCPDMCPEKERYRRMDELSVSVYEKQVNDPDAKLIVKEYSRSSADQEQPLPHELRPPEVLEMTMNHLICNVIDQFKEDSTVGEWYDFVWNRTRAIRKDIIQQDLCDLRCVSLVEKCARFHIHCSAVMCEEDASTFDQKINNINLTKSLQSLKYLYHDLMIKGIKCENEAEFLAYDVLLNLNEGDILRQIQQFPQAVRESPDVKFANKLFSALNSRNYIRFFKLVKQASYLSACILLRYFPQVRQRAVQSIVKAYCMPTHIGQFPMVELVKLLAFEGAHEARRFCAWLGLYVDDDNFVILDKSAITLPSTPPPIMRALQLIESKRNCSVGEVIHGGSLPPNPILTYNPHNSFDSNWRLKKESYDASDQGFRASDETDQPRATFSFTATLAESVSPTVHDVESSVGLKNEERERNAGLMEYDDELEMQALTTEIIDSIVDVLLIGVIQNSIVDCCLDEEAAHVLTTVTTEMHREIADDVIEEELLLIEEKVVLEKHLSQNKAIAEIREEFISHVVESEVRTVAKSVHEEKRKTLLEAYTCDVLESILEEAVRSFTSTIAAEVHAREEGTRILLQLVSDRTDLARARHFFTKWKLICLRRRRLQNAKKSFPAGPLLVTPKRIKKPPYLYSSVLSANRNQQRISSIIDTSLCGALIEEEISWHSMDVMSLVQRAIKGDYKKSSKFTCWKMGVLYPLSERPAAVCLREWITAKFSETPLPVDNDQLDFLRIEHDAKNGVAFSVVAIKHEIELNLVRHLEDSRKLFGLSALILFISLPERDEEYIKEVLKLSNNLKRVLRSKPPLPPVVVQVLVISSDMSVEVPEERLCGPQGLDLYELYAEGSVQSFQVHWIRDLHSVETTFQLEEGILWLAKNSHLSPDLKSAYLKDFIDDGLNLFVLDPLQKTKAEYIRDPEAIIDLFNEVMEHLARVISNPELENLSWPAPELCRCFENMELAFHNWNDRRRLKNLKTSVLELRLPSCDLENFLEVDAISEVSMFLEHLGIQDPTVISRIQYELSRSSFTESSTIPWINIFSCILQHRVSTLVYQDFEDGETGKEMMVHYFQEDFMNFHLPVEWVESTRESKYLTVYEEASKLRVCGAKHKLDRNQEDEPETKHPCWSVTEYDQTKDLSQNLQSSILLEKEEAKHFISNLENILLEGSPQQVQHFQFRHSTSKNAIDKIPPISQSTKSLDESIELLQTCILQEKEANSLYEAKLKQLLYM